MSTFLRRPLSRRTFLRGTLTAGGSVALGVPLLEAMLGPGEAMAEAARRPFFGIFYWANGLPWTNKHGAEQGQGGHPDLWTPPAEGDWTGAPPALLAPLASYRPNVVTGLQPTTDIPSMPGGQGDGHMRGFMVALTGDRPRAMGFDHSNHYLTSRRETLDQYVAHHPDFYGDATPLYRSIEAGVSQARFHPYGHWNAISYNGPGSLNLPILRPTQLYDRLFRVERDTTELERQAMLLDTVREDARALKQKLGQADRQRLEAHLEHVRAIERRLEGARITCSAPAAPGDGGDLIQKTGVMAELLALAISCDLTRVFSFMLTSPASTHTFSNLGVPDGMHKVCHDGRWQHVRAITEYQMQAFATFLSKFDQITTPHGTTLLEEGVIFGTSEYGEGWKHSVAELPALLVGGGGGRLARGQHTRITDGGNARSYSRAHLTALQGLGLPDATFGWNGGQVDSAIPGFLT